MTNLIAVEQLQVLVQVAPTPPLPAKSVFALAYMFLLRSCKLIGVFIIHPCLPFCWNRYKQQGPFAPPALPGFIATADPSATLSPSAHFPGSPVIGPTLLQRFRAGTRRASPVA